MKIVSIVSISFLLVASILSTSLAKPAEIPTPSDSGEVRMARHKGGDDHGHSGAAPYPYPYYGYPAAYPAAYPAYPAVAPVAAVAPIAADYGAYSYGFPYYY